MIISLATAFGAGFLASLSPCVYPMLPITLGFLTRQTTNEQISDWKKKIQVVSFFVGQVISFTLLGLVAVKLGEIFGFSSQSKSVNIAVGILLLSMAIISASTKAQELLAKMNQFVPQMRGQKSSSIFSALALGATSALVASPCTSPVLGGVLGQISSQGSFLSGLFQMLSFSIGMGLIFLILGLGLVNIKNLPKAGAWMNTIHKATTVILVLASGYYFWLAFQ
jgi:cytochrome c-type biogenesis protein